MKKKCQYTIDTRFYMDKGGRSYKRYEIIKNISRKENKYEEAISSHNKFYSAKKELKKRCK